MIYRCEKTYTAGSIISVAVGVFHSRTTLVDNYNPVQLRMPFKRCQPTYERCPFVSRVGCTKPSPVSPPCLNPQLPLPEADSAKMSSSSGTNYAQSEGIRSLAAAVIFTILYVPLFLVSSFLALRRPTSVFWSLSIFSFREESFRSRWEDRPAVLTFDTVRILAFTLRAILAGSNAAGHSLNLFIAEQIIYMAGFSWLLYAAYTLVFDRCVILELNLSNILTGIQSAIGRNKSDAQKGTRCSSGSFHALWQSPFYTLRAPWKLWSWLRWLRESHCLSRPALVFCFPGHTLYC